MPPGAVQFLREEAQQQQRADPWEGRDNKLKADNFAMSYWTEYAFGRILDRLRTKRESRGLYRGTAKVAPVDFKLWGDMRVGIRSRYYELLERWRQVPYPRDRLETEPKRISDYIVIAAIMLPDPYGEGIAEELDLRLDLGIEPTNSGLAIRFYGACAGKMVLDQWRSMQVIPSRRNQELSVGIPFSLFDLRLLESITKSDPRGELRFPVPAAAPAVAPNVSGDGQLAEIQGGWNDLIATLQESGETSEAALLRDAVPVALEDGVLLLKFSDPFHRDQILKRRKVTAEMIAQFFGMAGTLTSIESHPSSCG